MERLTLNYRQSKSESPHTYAAQYVNTAAQWNLEFTWPRMSHQNAELIASWLESLQGEIGTFTYSPRNSVASGLTGRSLAAPAYSYSTTARIGGWAAAGVSGLRRGQYFSIGEQLLRVTSAPANADANGQCLIEFAPMLRKDFAASTAVNFTNPSGRFRLASADTPGFTLDVDRKPEFPTILCKEAIG